MKKTFIGTSGYNYKDWKGVFYPEKLAQRKWLEFYSQQFKTVEINATFYGSFKQVTIENWYNQTPKDFCFAIKGTRYVTHVKRLHDIEEPIRRFFHQVEPLKEKLGVVLWQFPSNFTVKNNRAERLQRLDHLLKIVPQTIRQALEFRDESWFSKDVFDLLRSHNSGLVINQAKNFPYYEAITADFSYVRFHGPDRVYASKYTQDDMEYWAKKIKTYQKQGDVFAYFNNDFWGYAIENVRELLQHLKS